MTTEPRSGRPRVSSRETIAEAACELFLEGGYDATSISDITRRAGVSRSSFFNYFPAKGDLFWAPLDERLTGAAASLAQTDEPVPAVLERIAQGFAPDSLALGIVHADVMGVVAELERERAVRQFRLGVAAGAALRRGGEEPLRAEVRGAALSAAVFSAVWTWAADPGGADLPALLRRTLAAAG